MGKGLTPNSQSAPLNMMTGVIITIGIGLLTLLSIRWSTTVLDETTYSDNLTGDIYQ